MVHIDEFQFATDLVSCGREVLRVLRLGRRADRLVPRRLGDADLPDRFRHLEHNIMAVALNLIRLDARWNGQCLDPRRTTHLSRLKFTRVA